MDKKVTAKQFREITGTFVQDLTAYYKVLESEILKKLSNRKQTPLSLIKSVNELLK